MKTEDPSYGGRLWPDAPQSEQTQTTKPPRSGQPQHLGALVVVGGVVIVAALIVGGVVLERGRGADAPTGGESLPTGSSAPSPEVDIQPKAVRHVRAFTKPWSVRLTWKAPQGKASIDHFMVERNGASIGSTSKLEFRDDDVLPDGSYRYAITAVAAGGQHSLPVRLAVKTPIATQSEPTIAGTYSFRMQVTLKFGYQEGAYEGTYPIGLEFDQPCGVGCTSARFSYSGYPDITGVMYRTTDGFEGSTSGAWGVTCGQKESISQFTWDITILSVAPDNTLDELVADELRATVKVFEQAANGCRASGVTLVGSTT